MRTALLLPLAFLALPALAARSEEPVKPYVVTDANAGATPLDASAYAAFHGREGVARVVDAFIARNRSDPRTKEIFASADVERLTRVMNEHFCYVLGGGCAYTGRDMKTAHTDMGVQQRDMGAVVENLQMAMDKEHVPFAAQNRLLAKFAPMRRDVVQR